MEIFYADDQEVDQMLFKLALHELGIAAEVKTANDGEEAIKVLNDGDGYVPDMIFLDLKMPRKDGNECLEEIRKNEKFKLTPVVIFSNSIEESDVKKAYKNRANLYIQKPYDFDNQVELMKKLFSLNWREFFSQRSLKKFIFKV